MWLCWFCSSALLNANYYYYYYCVTYCNIETIFIVLAKKNKTAKIEAFVFGIIIFDIHCRLWSMRISFFYILYYIHFWCGCVYFGCNWLGLFTTEFLLSKEMIGKTNPLVISHTPITCQPTNSQLTSEFIQLQMWILFFYFIYIYFFVFMQLSTRNGNKYEQFHIICFRIQTPSPVC